MKNMIIPNTLNIMLAVLFLIVGVVFLPFADFGLRLLIGLGVLVVGFLLNMIGVVGGGDAKFAAAMIPFIPPEYLLDTRNGMPSFLITLFVMMLAAVATHRIFRSLSFFRNRTGDWKSWSTGKRFPMGFALAGSLLFHLAIRVVLIGLGAEV